MKRSSLLSIMNERFKTRTSEENYALILCGNVYVNGSRIRQPGEKVDLNAEITLSSKRYVSRGGLKLERALDYWKIEVSGKGFLDAGCSTGGFTDCLIQNGADFVHSVDVGYNQMDYSLKKNSRVILHEKTNIMNIESLSPVPSMGVADLSFRSIARAASKILDLVSEKKLIALVKPQFETERDNLQKGVISRLDVLEETLIRVIDRLYEEKSFVQSIISSPVQGMKGNNEFLFLITREELLPSDKLKQSISEIIRSTGS